jgi:hypothetical protein
VYTLALQQIATRTQGARIEAFLQAGGAKHSHWRVAGIGLAWLVAVLVIIFAIVFALPPDALPGDAA